MRCLPVGTGSSGIVSDVYTRTFPCWSVRSGGLAHLGERLKGPFVLQVYTAELSFSSRQPISSRPTPAKMQQHTTAPNTLLGLPPAAAAAVICKLSHADLRNFAATSSAALRVVLLRRTDLAEFCLSPPLHRALAVHPSDRNTDLNQRASLRVTCRMPLAPECLFNVLLPLHAAKTICASTCTKHGRDLCTFCSPIRALPDAALRFVKHLHREDGLPEQPFAVPEGMTALTEVRLDGCKLQSAWLPTGSAGRVRTLLLAASLVKKIPECMDALEHIDITACKKLAPQDSWLPASSAGAVRTLEMASSLVKCVPGGMRALEHINVGACKSLTADWLPASSAGSVRTLLMASSQLQRVPEGMHKLRVLDVSSCTKLSNSAYLPASSATAVTDLRMSNSSLTCVPAGMRSLQIITGGGCKKLDLDWLPPSSVATIRCLALPASSLQRIPEGLQSLEQVDVEGCKKLAPAFLPASSAECVRSIDMSQTNAQRLPGDMPLETLRAAECPRLEADFLPASSAACLQRVFISKSAAQRLPAGAPLLEIDASHCEHLAAGWCALPR